MPLIMILAALVGAFAIGAGGPSFAQDRASGCAVVNRVAVEAGLHQYSDTQIQNGLCMMTQEVTVAIALGDALAEQLCLEAASHFMVEFKRRFPGRDSSSVVGRC
jgi:hypothetical protein